MAIEVRYFEDTDECYTEGPFVIVNASGYRIECGAKGMKCPTLPDISIYAFLREQGLPDRKTKDKALATCIVDYLNAKVKDKTLTVNQHGYPIWELYEHIMREKRWQEKRNQQELAGQF